MSGGWKKQLCTVRCMKGEVITFEAYVKGQFALDRRAYNKAGGIQQAWGYVITHFPTGYIVRGVKGPLATAKKAADALLQADWNFTDPADCKGLSGHVKAVMADIPELASAQDFDSAPYGIPA